MHKMHSALSFEALVSFRYKPDFSTTRLKDQLHIVRLSPSTTDSAYCEIVVQVDSIQTPAVTMVLEATMIVYVELYPLSNARKAYTS